MTEHKDTFIKKTNFEISNLRNLKSVWEFLIDIVKPYDGKVINKRFINKAQEEIKKAGFTNVFIGFQNSWNGERQNKLELRVYDNYCKEANCYIDSTRLKDILYGQEEYMDENTFRMNAENFRLAVEYNNEFLENRIKELTECIDRIDEVIEKYENMRKYVETTLSSIPNKLREHISVPMPIIK